MKRSVAILVCLSVAVVCLGDDLITYLDAAWNRHDYPACRKLIEGELQKNPSNLTARVAMAAYHGWVEFDLAAATNSMPREVTDSASKTGKLATEIVDVWRAALSVPMEAPPTEKQKEFVRRDLWPTNYPERDLLSMLQGQTEKIGANQASDATSEPAPGAASSSHQR